ncbi:MAG: transcriptional regulator NrdR [Clostridia bacterium]|nr:transcriptional regulator NrdR [Clostridia bacterium]
MKCIYCGCVNTKVIDSRDNDDFTMIRRRRQCESCLKRFTTYEKVESNPVFVVKSNGNRQPFDSDKIKKGILKACEKRPVSIEKIDKLVGDIEKNIQNKLVSEITSKEIGQMVMDGLKDIDDVSYVRYASVYREFKDIKTLYDLTKTVYQNNKITSKPSKKKK